MLGGSRNSRLLETPRERGCERSDALRATGEPPVLPDLEAAARERDIRHRCEIHVHPAVLRLAALALPKRIALVTDAVRACGMPEGSYKLYGHDISVARGAAQQQR